MSKTIKPLGSRVLILLDDKEEPTSKIALTQDQLNKQRRKTDEGNVVSIGVDLALFADGALENVLKVGSRVMFQEGVGKHVVLHDKDHLILELTELVGVEVDCKPNLHLV